MGADAEWSFVPEYMKAQPPFDGAPVLLRLTVSQVEFEARFTQPDLALTDPGNMQAIQQSWERSDGQPMLEYDPPRFWKPI